jgi:hypothetical protein
MSHRFFRICGLLALFVCIASGAAAQSFPDAYVSTGFGRASRALPPRTGAEIYDPYRPLIRTAIFSGGVQVKPWLGIEGSVQWQATQSFPWRFTYQFAENTEELATHRDTPLVGYFRFFACHRRRVCVEPLIGGGLSWHQAESRTTARCGPGQFPRPCEPVATPVVRQSLATAEPLCAAGLDFPVRAFRGVWLGPSVRLLRISRRKFLIGNTRGPAGGNGTIWTVSVNATWRSGG